MALPKPLLIVIALSIAPLGQSAMADIVILFGLLCPQPSAVGPAVTAAADSNWEEVGRLGCDRHEPYRLGFGILRCEPDGMEWVSKSFGYPIRRDATLPSSVCEVEAILANGQVVRAYTDYALIYPWDRVRPELPRFQGPEGE